jgi:8-oxo-dGTP pyrophosphatase MutT (NUDIX family)
VNDRAAPRPEAATNTTRRPVETAPLPGESFAAWLTRVEREQTSTNIRPRDAATLILIDRSGASPKVLLGRRHHGHKFLPGKFVFPGGRVELADRVAPVAAPLPPPVEARLMHSTQRPSAAKARGFAVAAIREVFEETGLMLGRRAAAPMISDEPWGEFAAAGLMPDLSQFHFIARAITPPRRPRRFDTRFFAVDATAIGGRIDGVVGPDAELVELVWLPIAEARTIADVPTITKIALIELEARIAIGFSHERPVPFYRMQHRKFVEELL